MKKVVKKIKIGEEQIENSLFWESKTGSDRISAIQILREQYIKFFNKEKEYHESRKRLRRFYRAFKQTQS